MKATKQCLSEVGAWRRGGAPWRCRSAQPRSACLRSEDLRHIAPALAGSGILANARGFASLRQKIPGGWRNIALDGSERPGCTDEAPGRQQLGTWIRRSVLPRGYPHSVREGYITYVQWTALGLLAGRIQSTLATQSALLAVGLGAGAIPTAAAAQWILKDGVGHASAIVFATAVNTRFDEDAKRYRFYATAAAIGADLLAAGMPLYPQYFLALASISGGIRAASGVASMASRARIHASFALQENLADCTRTGSTQAKISSLLGTALGAGLCFMVSPTPLQVWSVMVPLACVSLYSTYISSRIVTLQSLNVQRTERLFQHMLLEMPWQEAGPFCQGKALHAPSPATIADEETFCAPYTSVFRRGLDLQPLLGPSTSWGARIPAALSALFARPQPRLELEAVLPLLYAASASPQEAGKWSANWYAGQTYAIAAQSHDLSSPVAVWHRSGASARSKLQAMWHACALRHCSELPGEIPAEKVHKRALQSWPEVLAAVEGAGWHVESVFLDGDGACLDPLPPCDDAGREPEP
mmetsp:Transcript_44392/g.96446  ORF Transcript_44392/g.96446 Transcript_44392/m.96446 type:complete len:528 (-) Transcript_44392:63-1646(-)